MEENWLTFDGCLIEANLRVQHLSNLLPQTCSNKLNYVTLSVLVTGYTLRTNNSFKLTNYRTTLREDFITIRGPRLWNFLSADVTDISIFAIVGSLNNLLKLFHFMYYSRGQATVHRSTLPDAWVH